jgi:hypothetical protein
MVTTILPSTFIDRIYNLISTIANLITLLVSLIFICSIINRLIYLSLTRIKISIEISVILSLNNLCLIIVRSLFHLIDIDLNTIKHNYFSMNEYENSFSCQFRGYFLLSIHVTLYWSYALHAFFRFIRIIYPHNIRLHRLSIYLYLFIPSQFVFGFLSVFPLFRGFNVIYLLPNEPYCTTSYNELASLIYMPVVAFIFPLVVISICYICMLWKMKHSVKSIRSYRQRNRRDYFILRRIIIILVLLSMVSFPLFLDLFIYLFT